MKKITVLATLLALSVGASAYAQGGFQSSAKHAHHHKGGFNAKEIAVSKVADASNWQDNQRIILQGNILEQVGKDDFNFRDSSGTMLIEIDDDAWLGQDITPADEVKLFGEVDKSWNKTEVEIYKVEKVK